MIDAREKIVLFVDGPNLFAAGNCGYFVPASESGSSHTWLAGL